MLHLICYSPKLSHCNAIIKLQWHYQALISVFVIGKYSMYPGWKKCDKRYHIGVSVHSYFQHAHIEAVVFLRTNILLLFPINVLTWLNHTQHMTVNISETHVQVSYIQKDKHLITNLSQKSQHINKLSKAVRHRLYRRLTCHPVSSLSACAWAHEGLGAPS